MKLATGIWLPESDTHFAEHLMKGPKFKGAGTYQMKKIELALGEVKRNGKFNMALDIGAHVGLWSRVLVGHFTKLVAFEPVPEFGDCYHRNMEGCNKSYVLVRCALGNESGATCIVTPKDNSGNAHVFTGNEVDKVETQIEKLDRFHLVQQDQVDFIKIDCEGFELQVIKGAEETIKRCKPVLVIEQKPGNGSRYGWHDRAAVDLVLTWGAKIKWEKSGDYCLGWH